MPCYFEAFGFFSFSYCLRFVGRLEIVVNTEHDVVSVEVHAPYTFVCIVILLVSNETNMCYKAEFVKFQLDTRFQAY